MVEQIGRRRAPAFDACVLGDAPALQVFNDIKRYGLRYSMPMPSAEQRVLAPMSAPSHADLGYGEYSLIRERVSTLLFHMETLSAKGRLHIENLSVIDREPHLFLDVLGSGDTDQRVIAWSPHWQVYSKLGLAQPLNESAFMYRNLLFLRGGFTRKYPKKAKLLPILVRDAWIQLRKPGVRQKTIAAMLADSSLVEAYWRFCGLHRLPNSPM
jgi:hypothetical protein